MLLLTTKQQNDKYLTLCVLNCSGNNVSKKNTPYQQGTPCSSCPANCDNGLCSKFETITLYYGQEFIFRDFSGGLVVKTPMLQCRRHGFDPWLRHSDPTCHTEWFKKNFN